MKGKLLPVAASLLLAPGCVDCRLSAPGKVAYHRATPAPADAAKVCVW